MKFDQRIVIENKEISEDGRTFIIAEAGVNHNGDMSIAKKMIDVAVEAGADAVKFQTFKAEELILKNVEKAPYQKKTTSGDENQYEMLRRLEVSKEQNLELKHYCDEKKIIFLSTPFESVSLDELDDIGVGAYKVAATDLTNIQFLEQVAKKNKPIILSAGMCYLEEVEIALQTISKYNKKLILLQCTANYPISDDEANLRVIQTFKDKFGMIVGYSDHSEGVGASPYAVAIGAKVIEKHFTLDKSMGGPDQKASVSPDELKKLISEIRKVEKYLGNGIKMPSKSEQYTRKSLQKCLVAACDIQAEDVFSENNIVAKRTDGVGIGAIYYNDILGLPAQKSYRKNDIIG